MDYDFSKAFELFDEWYKSVDEKLRADRISETFHELEVSEQISNFKHKFLRFVSILLVVAASAWFWCHQLGTDKSESDTNGFGWLH